MGELYEETLRVELLGLRLRLECVQRRPRDGLDDVREPGAEVTKELGVHLGLAGERVRGVGVRGALDFVRGPFSFLAFLALKVRARLIARRCVRLNSPYAVSRPLRTRAGTKYKKLVNMYANPVLSKFTDFAPGTG